MINNDIFLCSEYRIPGTAAPDGSCSFTYRSSSRKKGEFNSPRYPSNYPSETNCTYLFLATPNEQVSLVFDHFKVRADTANSSIGSYGYLSPASGLLHTLLIFINSFFIFFIFFSEKVKSCFFFWKGGKQGNFFSTLYSD